MNITSAIAFHARRAVVIFSGGKIRGFTRDEFLTSLHTVTDAQADLPFNVFATFSHDFSAPHRHFAMYSARHVLFAAADAALASTLAKFMLVAPLTQNGVGQTPACHYR